MDLAALAAQHPGRVTVLKVDVTREDDIKGAAEVVKKSFGKVDLMINSSAMLHPTGKGETSLRDISAEVRGTEKCHPLSNVAKGISVASSAGGT